MRRVQLNKKRQRQIYFNSKLNQKSNYLKNLDYLNNESTKEIEDEKIDILIDKCLGINKFERDYSFFSPPINASHSPSPSKDNKKQKKRLFPELKVLITSPDEKEYPNKYKKKDYIEDSFSNIYKNSKINKNNAKDKISNKINDIYKPNNRYLHTLETNKINDNSRNDQNTYSSFLTGIGKTIMTQSIDDGETVNLPRMRNIFNNISIK